MAELLYSIALDFTGVPNKAATDCKIILLTAHNPNIFWSDAPIGRILFVSTFPLQHGG